MYYNAYVNVRRWIITLFEKIKKEASVIADKIDKLQKELSSLPEEHLVCCCSQEKYFKWYSQIKGIKKYISKKNKAFAEKLATKKYLQAELDYFLTEQKAINSYLRIHKNNTSIELLNHPGYKELLEHRFRLLSQELIDWTKEDFPTNSSYPEGLKYRASNGKKVRSKSEVIIDQALFYNKIPFRYEAELQVGFSKYYPDFTIRHPQTGEIYLWEHFGLMNDIDYSSRALRKINAYISMGIFPGENLIMTFETDARPLDSALVNSLIEYYFL